MPIPSFTVLDDGFQVESDQYQEQPAPWQSMYMSNITSAPPNSPFAQYDVPHMDSDYESLTHSSRSSQIPHIPSSYNEGLINNAAVSKKNLRYNLPAQGPAPMPSYIDLPTMTPPYGMPYPSNGYSAFDGTEAMNAGIPQFYSIPGVPVASWPSLEDARNSPGIPANPATMVVVAEQHFKEGFKQGLEHFTAPTCSDSIHHISSCPVCNHFVTSDKKFFKLAIGFLIILVLILLYILFRKTSRHKD